MKHPKYFKQRMYKTLYVIISSAVLLVGIILTYNGVYTTIKKVLFIQADKLVVYADELDLINKQKNEKQKELQNLDTQIEQILKSKVSVSQKLQQLKEKLQQVQKQQKELEKQLDKLNKQLMQTRQQRQEYYAQGAQFLTQSTSWLTIVKSMARTSQKNQQVQFVDSLLTYLSLKWYYSNKISELTAKEQQLYGQFLQTKENLDTAVRLVKDLQAHLKTLQDQYNATLRSLSASYSRKTALVNEITALSAKARRIIEQKASQNSSSNTIGDSSGAGGPVNVNNGSGDYTIIIPGQDDIYLDNKVSFLVQDSSCDGTSVPTCPNGYMEVIIYNADKSKNGGTWKYRGELATYSSLQGAFFVNKIRLEDYVLGIGEMHSSWGATGGMEALKAQAVAARTYAYAKVLNGWTLSDSPKYDQNYIGANKELAEYGDKWVNAVKSTKGQVLKSNGQVISAYYHSSCGGATLSTQEVWGGYRSYALGISDRYQENGKWVPYDKDSPYTAYAWGNADVPMIYLKDLLNAAIYLQLHATGSYVSAEYQDKVACPLPQTSVVGSTLTFSTISNKQFCNGGLKAIDLHNVLGNNAIDKQFDTITKVYTTFKDNNGNPAGDQFNVGENAKYTDSVVVEGTKNGVSKKIYIPAGFFKLAYNLRSPGTNYIRQPSTKGALFDIWQKTGDYSARTYGLGHRVGLCQYGAYGRAKQGDNYVEILTAYYANLSLNNGAIPQAYSDAGPIIRVKITQVAGTLCDNSTCDASIANGTYVTKIRANAGNLLVKNEAGNVVATVPAGTWIEVKR